MIIGSPHQMQHTSLLWILGKNLSGCLIFSVIPTRLMMYPTNTLVWYRSFSLVWSITTTTRCPSTTQMMTQGVTPGPQEFGGPGRSGLLQDFKKSIRDKKLCLLVWLCFSTDWSSVTATCFGLMPQQKILSCYTFL